MSGRSDPAELIRALVLGDDQAMDHYQRRLDDAGWAGARRFLSTLFFMTVRRRFASHDEADIIRFVADIRATTDPSSINPSDAEALIRKALDPDIPISITQDQLGRIQTLVVYRVLADENLAPEALDDRLREAEELAAG